ncbi:hypothetical protein D3C77_358950 [compost metagenome]
MAPDSFLIENRPFIALLIHLQRRIDEQRHPVARIQPENPVLHFAFLDREMRFADRIVLVVADPFEDARRLHWNRYEAPGREMQIARAVRQMEHRNRLFIQFAGNEALNEFLDRLVLPVFNDQEVLHRLRNKITELIG